MAITPQEQSNIIALTVALFDAPPGAQYLAELTAVYEQNNNSYEALTNFIIATPAFNAQYANAQSIDDQITIALQNFGLEPGSAAFEEAAAVFAQRAADGATETEILLEAGTYLLGGNVAPSFADIAAKFANKVNVATYYSVELGLSNDNIAELKSVLFTVTENPVTAAAARAGLNSEGGITYTLSQAVAIELSADRSLPDVYTIAENASLYWGEASIEQIQTTLLSINAIIENAFNSEDLVLENLFAWDINDTAEAILDNLENTAVIGAASVSVSDAPVTFEQYTALLGLENLDADALEVSLSLAEALTIINAESEIGEDDEIIPAPELPTTYRIELVEEPVSVGELSVAEAEALEAQVDALVEGAVNAEEINESEATLASQISWTLVDSAAAIIAAINSDVVTGANAIVLSDATISQDQFDQLNGLSNFSLGETVVSETLTLAQALASLNNNIPLPANYTISPTAATEEADVSVAEAQAVLADVQDIFAGALNTSQLDAQTLLNWNIVDDATAVLGAAGTPAITGAGIVSVNNESLTQTQYNSLLENVPNFELSEDTAVNLTLPAAFALATSEDADALPTNYSIDVDGAVLNAGTVSVEDAQNAYAIVAEILDNAANEEAPVLADLFLWAIEDDAATIVAAAGNPAVSEANSIRITNDTITQGQLDVLSQLAGFELADGVEVIGVAFNVDTTAAVAETDAVASVYTLTANLVDFGTADRLVIRIDDEAVEFGVSAAKGGTEVATELNGNNAFTGAGFSAAYDNGVLTITDAEGRTFAEGEIELLAGDSDATPSTATVTLLNSSMLGIDTVRLTIGEQEVVLYGIEGENAAEVANSIQSALQSFEVEGETPFDHITVDYTNNVLTFTDSERRPFDNLTLNSLSEGSSSSASFALTEAVMDAETGAFQLVLSLNGETSEPIVLPFDESDIDPTALQDALQAAIDDNITVSIDNGTLTITDAIGRPFGTDSRLLNEGEPVASVTRLGPLNDAVVAQEAGQFSATVGNNVVELLDISEIDTLEALATAIQTAFDDAAITVTADSATNELLITDALGRGISDVYIGTDVASSSTVTLSNLTNLVADNVESFSLTIGNSGEVAVDLTNVDDIATLLIAIEASLENVADVSAAASGTRGIVITDTRGRELSSNIEVAQTSTATVGGLSNNAINLDLATFEITYTDGNDTITRTLVKGEDDVDTGVVDTTAADNGDVASLTFELDTVALVEGDTVTISLPASAVNTDGGTLQSVTVTVGADGGFGLESLTAADFVDGGTTPALLGSFAINEDSQIVFTYTETGEQDDLASAALEVSATREATPETTAENGGNPAVISFTGDGMQLAEGTPVSTPSSITITLPASATDLDEETASVTVEFAVFADGNGGINTGDLLAYLNDVVNYLPTVTSLNGTFENLNEGGSGDESVLGFVYNENVNPQDLDDAALSFTFVGDTVESEVGEDATAQITTVSFADIAVVEGYEYSVSVNGNVYSYTAVAEDDWAAVLGGLEAVIEADEAIGVEFDEASRTLALTSETAGTAGVFTVDSPEVINTNLTPLSNQSDFLAALQALLGDEFVVEQFGNSFVIQGPDGVEITSVESLSEGELNVGNVTLTDAIASIVAANSETSGTEPLAGVEAVVEAEGEEQGENAADVGDGAVVVDAEDDSVGISAGPEYVAGEVEDADATRIGEFAVEVEGSEATDAEPWMATITLESAEEVLVEDYTFTLTLTESDAEEPAIATFSVSADAGTTLAEVAELLAATVNADEGDFADMFTAAWDEDSASFSLVAANEDGVNFDLETDATVIGVYDPGM